MSSHSRRTRTAVGLVLCALVAACTGGPVSTTNPSAAPSAPATAPPATVEASPDDFDRVLAFAAGTSEPADSDLGELWAEVFREITIDDAEPYAPPAAVRSYLGGEAPETACTASGAAARWKENALYCGADAVIAYDEAWLRPMGEEFSYFAPVTVLAHEWAHHVQSILGDFDHTIQKELQADCFSGLYATASGLLSHGGDRSSELLAMEQGLRTWFDLGDDRYLDSEWFDPGVHGSPQQRMTAFTTGATSNIDFPDPEPSMTGGVPWCYGYRDFKARDYTEIGPYRLLNPPGRAGAWNGDVYVLPPEARTSRETSAIALAWIPDLPLDGGATEAQLREVWRIGYPNLVPIAAVPIEDAVSSGTGAAWYYENRTTPAGGGEQVDSGIFGLLSPEDAKGGLLILVFRPEPAPRDAETPANVDVLEDEVATFYQVTGRLCTPDESGDASAPNLDVVCMTELQ